MTVEKIIQMSLVQDITKIFIRDENIRVCGNWYQDNILEYLHKKVECFTWKDNNTIHIDVK